MESHQHNIADAIKAHDEDIDQLFDAANGEKDNINPDRLAELGVDPDEVEDSAICALDAYALEVTVRTIATVVLTTGGPHVEMTATIERTIDSWVRVGDVTYTDTFAVPTSTFVLAGSPLEQLFDRYVESMP